jgi:hypothetical protein
VPNWPADRASWKKGFHPPGPACHCRLLNSLSKASKGSLAILLTIRGQWLESFSVLLFSRQAPKSRPFAHFVECCNSWRLGHRFQNLQITNMCQSVRRFSSPQKEKSWGRLTAIFTRKKGPLVQLCIVVYIYYSIRKRKGAMTCEKVSSIGIDLRGPHSYFVFSSVTLCRCVSKYEKIPPFLLCLHFGRLASACGRQVLKKWQIKKMSAFEKPLHSCNSWLCGVPEKCSLSISVRDNIPPALTWNLWVRIKNVSLHPGGAFFIPKNRLKQLLSLNFYVIQQKA